MLPDKTVIHFSETLTRYFTCHEIPQKINLNTEQEFNNETLKELLRLHKINVHFTTLERHETNANVRRHRNDIIFQASSS